MAKRNILFIALGGSAGEVTAQLKKKISKTTIMERNIQFLLIDSEEFDSLKTVVKQHIDEEKEFFFLGRRNPYAFITEIRNMGEKSSEYRNLNSFFDISNEAFVDTIPNTIISSGAGRKRYVGRLLLYILRSQVSGKVREKINNMKGGEDTSKLNIVLISSCCGGTGSAIFYDILRLVSSDEIDLFPLTIGPSLHVKLNERINDIEEEKMKMNAFAFFEELGRVHQIAADAFKRATYVGNNRNLPFKLLFHDFDGFANDGYSSHFSYCLWLRWQFEI